MAAMGFDVNDVEAGNVSKVCWKSNHRINHDYSSLSYFAEADI